ncbi:MAG: DUF2203 family protein [Streptosporangiales bacterium]|nr:DUF2203 family protein [Streptosporangiales bacterium]
MNERVFTVVEADALMPEVRRRAAEIIHVRADLSELVRDLRSGNPVPGGRAAAKAYEARLDELASWFTANGIEVKSLAPILVDFPAELAGTSVRLCWLEGETGLDWYHRSELGFVGRRRLPPEAR